ncbi:oligosaccharide flippase family protein [Vibrio sp. SG41-7]|uniref:oligosaccharide flippase family protein n=1 Tax=Vibrio sp. SG41-7 TaxID=2760973 RepID=UPI0016033B6B|nr:oligosaccharide flippase family protein [Vibrio sp. SG41-7]MBB1464846.1 oligosaccharide flippase family protein [Vibrio sp. SG41-7]
MSKLYNAIAKSLTGRLATYIVQFSSLAVYSRIFTPTQFGVIASLQLFVVFFQMLSDIGIGPAIINEKKFESKQRDGVFTVTLIFGVFLAVVFYAFSFLINEFYNGFEYQKIAALASVGIIFSSLSIVPVTALNKDAKFYQIALADVVSEILTLAIILFLWTLEFGIIALASRALFQPLFKFCIVLPLSKKTNLGLSRLGREVWHIKILFKFSVYQFGFNFINYFSRNMDNLIVAKVFGTISLGFYDRAYQLMRYPLMLTTFAMTPAIQPVLTRYRDDTDYIVKEHNDLAARLLLISTLISVFLYFNAENVVLIIFGEQWLASIEYVKVFSLIIPIQAVLSTSGSFYQVMNAPRWLFISGLISALFNLFAIIGGASLGEPIYVAYGLVISFLINFVQNYSILFKVVFGRGIFDFLVKLYYSLRAISIPCFIYCCVEILGFNNNNLLPLFNVIINGLICVVLMVFSRNAIKEIILTKSR